MTILTPIYLFPSGCSSATGYLTSDVRARPNLTVSTNTFVEKVLFSTGGNTPRAIGVQVTASNKATKFRADKEVILSAGAISSPHLLFVSGIGSAEELNLAKVPLVKDLPAVGKHLLDVGRHTHPFSSPYLSTINVAYNIWPGYFPLQSRHHHR